MLKKNVRAVVLLVMVMSLFSASNVMAWESPVNLGAPDSFQVVADANPTISQDIDGTVIVLGNAATITSKIDGDLFVFCNTLDYSGEVTGNVYFFANSLSIGGIVAKDAFVFGNIVTMTKEGDILRDALLFGNNVNIGSKVGRDAYVSSAAAVLNALIGRNVNADTDSLTVTQSAQIHGKLSYRSAREAEISSGSEIGSVQWEQRQEQKQEQAPRRQNIFWPLLWNVVMALFSTLLIWLFMTFATPVFNKRAIFLTGKKCGRTILTGLIALICIPIAAVILMITVLGIGVGFAAAALYTIALYLSVAVAIIAITNVLVQKTGISPVHKNIWYVLIVALVISLLRQIPYFGALLSLALVLFGLGLLCSFLFKKDPPEAEPLLHSTEE